jgi:hypothetical protein
MLFPKLDYKTTPDLSYSSSFDFSHANYEGAPATVWTIQSPDPHSTEMIYQAGAIWARFLSLSIEIISAPADTLTAQVVRVRP